MNKQAWIALAEQKGIDGFEIYESVSSSRRMSWFDQKRQAFTVSKVTSTSMRALMNGKITSISLEEVKDEEAEKILDQLKEQSQVIADTEQDILVSAIETEEVQSKRRWIRPSVEEISQVLQSLEEKFKSADPRVIQVEVEYSDGSSKRNLMNSLGVNANDESTVQSIVAQITMKENDEIRDGYEISLVENLNEFDQNALVDKLIEEVSFTLGAKSMKSATLPVIVKNDAMSSLLSCFASMFYGDMISMGISPISHDLKKKIMSEKITIVDDPRNQEALSLMNYDDEGYPTCQKDVVKAGTFEMVLHNTKSALKMKEKSTGNGFKKGGGATAVSYSNLYIVPGQDSLSQMEEKMKNGIVITDLAGLHAGVDGVTTNFSLQASGYLIKEGKKDRPVTLITIAANFLELMNQVVEVGSDLDWSYRSCVSPSIWFEGIAISGKE